jgi:tetratricopeptide (TPR) repeat protein
MAVAALMVVAGFAFLADFARRALVNGPDTLGVLSIATTALLAGGALSGQVQAMLSKLPVAKGSTAAAYVLAAVVTLLAGFALDTAGAQNLASVYARQATSALKAGHYTDALGFFQKAIDLDNGQYDYHFGLASAYDKLLDSDMALVEYQAAHKLDPNQPWPLLDLAEIYLRRSSSDYVNALAEVNLVTGANLDDWAKYILHRDRGWIYLGLGYLPLADTELQTALNVRRDVPGANCLLAILKEAESDNAAARDPWKRCGANYEPINSEQHEYLDPRWPALAETRKLGSSSP